MRSARYRFIPGVNGRFCLAMFLSLICGLPQANAEWYVAGYGGLSAPNSLGNVKMDTFGEQQALAQFPQAQVPPRLLGGQDTLTQSFKTSDLALKNSPMFGGKAGYFFKDERLDWLGVELEAFISRPTIKEQTVNTNQEITYIPKTEAGPLICGDPALKPMSNCSQTRIINSTKSFQSSSMRLMTLAFNVVARYPGTVFQPYAGVGVGAFYFTSSTGFFQGRQVVPGLNAMAGLKVLVTEELGFFLEGKYNRATLTNFDPTYGLSGEYSAFNFVAGVAYHF